MTIKERRLRPLFFTKIFANQKFFVLYLYQSEKRKCIKMQKVEFEKVTTKTQLEDMSELATKILKAYYDPIVGEEINGAMLKSFQSVEGINKEIEEGGEYYFVTHEGARIGFVAVEPKKEYYYLSKFYLLEEYRGKGLASQMFSFVKEKALKSGYDKIILNVNAANADTIARYKHFGFVVKKDIQRQVGEDMYVHDYVMQNDIA